MRLNEEKGEIRASNEQLEKGESKRGNNPIPQKFNFQAKVHKKTGEQNKIWILGIDKRDLSKYLPISSSGLPNQQQ